MVDCKRCVFYGKCTIANEFAGQIRKCRDFTLQTNADRIRSMNDEELAEWLTKVTNDAQRDARTKCDYQWGEWLKSEVKE